MRPANGKGKTYGVKYFVKNLNPNLYKIVYLSLSTVTVMEFYRSFCIGLGIELSFKKIDMFNQIQERLKTLVKDRRITPIIICDEAQYLKTGILNDLKMLLNFEMDSKDYAVLILVGQPMLNDVLSRNVHEALNQRIIVNYMFIGIEFEEVKKYIIDISFMGYLFRESNWTKSENVRNKWGFIIESKNPEFNIGFFILQKLEK